MAPTRKDLLLDFDAGNCRVPAIQCEVWEGFIFINLDTGNTQPLRTFLGELAHGLEGYPFAGPHQIYRFKAELQCNRSEEHTSELQSLMRISYAVFCLNKKSQTNKL